MEKRSIWIIGLIQAIILVSLVVKIIYDNNEITKLKNGLSDSQDILVNSQKSRKLVNKENKPPPPGKTFDGGGHWHAQEWHDSPHVTSSPNISPSDIDLLKNSDTENQLDSIKKGLNTESTYNKSTLRQDLMTNLSDEQKKKYIDSTREMYSQHKNPELRRYAELFPKIIWGERMTLQETYDFMKGGMIINPNESTRQALDDIEKRMNK